MMKTERDANPAMEIKIDRHEFLSFEGNSDLRS
jgi:hypothetical protein